MSTQSAPSVGIEFTKVRSVKDALTLASSQKYDFLVVPIIRKQYGTDLLTNYGSKQSTWPAIASRLKGVGESADMSTALVALIRHVIDVDSSNIHIRNKATKLLQEELAAAQYFSVARVIIRIRNGNSTNLIRIAASTLNTLYFAYWFVFPTCASGNFDDDSEAELQPWLWWNKIYKLLDYHGKVYPVLELSADVPSEQAQKRWLGEPVRAVILPTKIFTTNAKGFPVLSPAHQLFIIKLIKLKVQFIIKGINPNDSALFEPYLQYLKYITRQTEPTNRVLEAFTHGYEDRLQVPLQPLADNLESRTYEIFEKDPIKYVQYEKAVYQALIERYDPKTTVIIMVVGAGRGPLVNRALEAADRAKYKVHIYAVEKNPMAIISLYAQKQEWADRVTIIHQDMRSWQPECKADIMVSELLGSFGDNELSPECLDGAQRYLKDDGISIPYAYTSFISPVQSPRIFSELLYNRDANKPYYANFETPFVVYLHNCFFLAETKPLFTFLHPNFATPIDNSRYEEVEFTIPATGTMHGLAGFFEAKLYKDITISIEPNTHSKNLISWFPMFFPIREPVTLQANSKIKVNFWRCCSSSQVWYEWTVIEPTTLPIHNPTGRSFSIGK
ncbi:unnamed protein product [Rotaria socialis]|uniref:Protein arginine N-methyltransferase n=1 Tax=Rotaria socialis TaxID=392032 RepID=A0A819XRA5_9BILA|nr:unnamed protein product [Rotaria socialis]CAF3206783.1 unnamed protein product [Rotaria socialis]CAF3376285.1 unnamed protein product [Rotaria socialis]CAF4140546.1 unnamed protein product [Rotaria socialis]CAF4227558.1 unnamed protein product [Rotaria socialis]